MDTIISYFDISVKLENYFYCCMMIYLINILKYNLYKNKGHLYKYSNWNCIKDINFIYYNIHLHNWVCKCHLFLYNNMMVDNLNNYYYLNSYMSDKQNRIIYMYQMRLIDSYCYNLCNQYQIYYRFYNLNYIKNIGLHL